jgi:hypothetical protein
LWAALYGHDLSSNETRAKILAVFAGLNGTLVSEYALEKQVWVCMARPPKVVNVDGGFMASLNKFNDMANDLDMRIACLRDVEPFPPPSWAVLRQELTALGDQMIDLQASDPRAPSKASLKKMVEETEAHLNAKIARLAYSGAKLDDVADLELSAEACSTGGEHLDDWDSLDKVLSNFAKQISGKQRAFHSSRLSRQIRAVTIGFS